MKRVLAVLLSAVLSLSVAVVPGIQTLAEEPDAAQKTEGQQEAEVEFNGFASFFAKNFLL